jgi:DNA polymerase-3 subunit delta'
MTGGILGQGRALTALRRAVESGRVPHAYLFVGPRGVGKYSTALEFAATLQCLDEAQRPCGVCRSCKLVAKGDHPDLFQPKRSGSKLTKNANAGSKETGFLGDIVPMLGYAPVLSAWKVVILDDAHQLTDTAANFLLKTLEEPPSRTIFILVTHAEHLLLDTVRSRCRRLRFAPLTKETLVGILTSRGVDEEQARAVAPLAEGSAGVALELLDGGQLELAALFDGLLAALKAGRAAEGQDPVTALFAAAGKGRTERQMVELLVDHLKKRISGAEPRIVARSLAKGQVGPRALLTLIDEADRNLKLNSNPRITADWLFRKLASGGTPWACLGVSDAGR